ncbi:MAG: thiamine-phosphate kinase [Alphaproteobacteria bacterium]|nr:thiamine-phosphate kinase [Alphaproteobacteria bacterium]
MSGAEDEFGEIARLFRPLTFGAAGAFDLMDDAAVIQSRPGCDLVVTKDAVVEGVHAPQGEAPGLIAQKLVRVNLSDLAAKAAEPAGCFLAVAWPRAYGPAEHAAFAEGLAEDLRAFGLPLLGGDTVVTPGPAWASLTALGWVPQGKMVRRAGARSGDVVWVSGTIGDGALGLAALRGDVPDTSGFLLERYRRPNPRLDLREQIRACASAAADVSDGLVADAGHIAEASGVRLILDLQRMPLSGPAREWLRVQTDRDAALLRLATGGDDYEIVCAAPPGCALPGFTAMGEIASGAGVEVRAGARKLDVGPGGWRHF